MDDDDGDNIFRIPSAPSFLPSFLPSAAAKEASVSARQAAQPGKTRFVKPSEEGVILGASFIIYSVAALSVCLGRENEGLQFWVYGRERAGIKAKKILV